jgi:hypothetical protein
MTEPHRPLWQIQNDMTRLRQEAKAARPGRLFAPGFKRERSFRPEAPGQRQPRERDNAHLAFIRRLPCASCGVPGPCDAAPKDGSWIVVIDKYRNPLSIRWDDTVSKALPDFGPRGWIAKNGYSPEIRIDPDVIVGWVAAPLDDRTACYEGSQSRSAPQNPNTKEGSES